ncbi:DUF3159 domain-containing protein [Mycolicibacterium fallax]|uniref:Uncharacterized protein n=1 Tax=Mycolicibacterium fallax TaxID=1793 RepID=A0A1X1RDG5_MYCFA|nr:hypothetical protein [Mycolicibacterium fallax]ORV03513.1 hypothetical protein AWC04_10425 [Mycolicibacterium fallax]BBY97428.1 hypothetical protein MFAL_08950 [Mycolicibacterium fallax]HOW95227.1 hypothetical protein [Mycolicibacterium fallax]
MSILFGFSPWIIYWLLVGNVPFGTSVLCALGVAALAWLAERRRGAAGCTLQIGAVATFGVLAVLTTVASTAFLERWMQPLSTAGIVLVTVVGALIGRPFIREFAEPGQPPEVVGSELFARITERLTWIWIALFAAMTVSSAIPPIVQGDATILDTRTPLSFVFYWVIPALLMATGAIVSKVLPERMMAGFDDEERNTTFVAYSEAAIDELYFLARERAGREVRDGQEAYDIKLGAMGVPLTGDESRKSWPMSYRVRTRA